MAVWRAVRTADVKRLRGECFMSLSPLPLSALTLMSVFPEEADTLDTEQLVKATNDAGAEYSQTGEQKRRGWQSDDAIGLPLAKRERRGQLRPQLEKHRGEKSGDRN